MTGILVLIGLVGLVVAALELRRRRTVRHWRPGSDLRNDRDAARIDEELRAAGQFEPGATGGREPIRLVPPRSAATDDRLVTRVAA